MRDQVLAFLTEEFPDIDFTASDKLVDDGILDSLTVTNIISELCMEYDIVVPYKDIVEENFNSIDAIANLVERLKGEGK